MTPEMWVATIRQGIDEIERSLRIGSPVTTARGDHRFPWEEAYDRQTANEMSAAAGPVPLDPEQELRTWWFNKASAEIEMTVAKAIEYGADDLIEIGRQMADVMHQRGAVSTDAELAELGVYFYLIGKVARWTSAIRRGDRPSDDTLLDIGVYVRMAQRIRDAGGWPGTEPK